MREGKRKRKSGFDRGVDPSFIYLSFGFGLDLCWASKGWVLFVGFINKKMDPDGFCSV